MNYSPLRYPGGKGKITPLVSLLLEKAGVKNGTYIEPFAGGSGVALSLLLTNKVKNIVINDYDKAIYAFWYSVINDTERFIELIDNTDITINEWKKQKNIFTINDDSDLLKLGFAAFFLNRTNRSGILKAGPIGGFDQTGNYSLDVRFNKSDLIKRIIKINNYKNAIALYNLDILDFLSNVLPNYKENTFVYFDPPYYIKGHELYVNFFTPEDHKKIATQIQNCEIDWMVTYDNVPEIKALYQKKEQKLYDLRYSLANKVKKSEIIILNRNFWPTEQESRELKINLR